MIRLANKQEVNFLNSQLEYKISENNFEKCYIDEQNNIIIGLIDFSDLYDRLELNYIWVNPDYRGNKNSYTLMDYMIDYAIKKGHNNITLEVCINNDIAINLYKKFEFKEVALRKQYYNGIDGILMMRTFDMK